MMRIGRMNSYKPSDTRHRQVSITKTDTMESTGEACFVTAKSTLPLPVTESPTIEVVEHPGNNSKLTVSGHVTAVLSIDLPVGDEGLVSKLKEIKRQPNVTSSQKETEICSIRNHGNGYVTVSVFGAYTRHQLSDKLNEKGWKLLGYSASFCPKTDGMLYAEKWGQRGRSKHKSGDSPRSKPSSSRCSSVISVQDEDIPEMISKKERKKRRGSVPPAQP